MSGMKHIPSTPILDTEYSAHFAGLRQSYESTVPHDGKAIRLRHSACARFVFSSWPSRVHTRGSKGHGGLF